MAKLMTPNKKHVDYSALEVISIIYYIIFLINKYYCYEKLDKINECG